MKIAVIGTGYVGLVTGTCLADFGMHVTCVDNNEDKINMLKSGEVPIYEIGLKELIAQNVKRERLFFTTDITKAINASAVIYIGVGTPENEDGTTNMTYLHSVIDQIAETMTESKVLVIKSTVPVGTAEDLTKRIKEKQSQPVPFEIVSNPEFLREGSAINDFLRPDRVVLGTDSEQALAVMKEIYRPLYLLDTPIVTTDNKTAELIKYAANTMLALKISFINELSQLCDRTGADIYDIAKAVGMDKRIGPKFFHPGPGFGGSCFPKDIKSLIKVSSQLDYDFIIGNAVMAINYQQMESIVAKCIRILGNLDGKKIGMLGLSFKPNTDDIREAPATFIADKLLQAGASIQAYDPAAMEETKKVLPNITYCETAYDACEGVDLIFITTEWNEFRELDLEKLRNQVHSPNLYDTRNIYTKEKVNRFGFKYFCTGRPDDLE